MSKDFSMAFETQTAMESFAPIERRRKSKDVGVIAGAAATALGQYLDQHGADGSAILRQAKLDPLTLQDRYAYVSIRAMARALELGAEATGDPFFGLHFAESFEPAVSHACNYAIRNAPDARAALNALADHRDATADIPTTFKDRGAVAHFSWTFNDTFDAQVHITDYTMMRTLYHIQCAAGDDWRPLSVHLTYDAPESDEEYRRIFGPNVHFNRNTNCFVIDGGVLEYPMPDADPDLYIIARNSMKRPRPTSEPATASIERVRRFIGDRLENNGGTFAAAAEHVGLSTHQLRSLLKRHDTCFQCVVDDTRKTVAEHYLLHTDLRFSEITFLLGFSDQSVFTRAVKRWFGVTPKQIRNAR